MMSKEQILIVEDEGLVAEDIKAHLEENGWHVPAIVASGEDALEIMKGTHIDLVLMDIVLAGEKDGIDTAAIIKDKYQTPVIYLTAYVDQEKVDRARLTDPYGYLVKPFDERELKTTVSMTLSKSLNDRAIREGKRWASAVLDSIEDGVITTDSSGRVRDINPKACALLEINLADSISKLLPDILHFSDKTLHHEFNTSINRILQSGSSTETRLCGQLLVSAADTIIDAKLSSISYSSNSIDGLVVTFHDVTLEEKARLKLLQYNTELEQRVKQRTQEITRALENAEAANIAKSRFLANISHELRTPLVPVASFSQLLMMDKSLTEKQRGYSGKIYNSSQSLLEKIDKLIELSRHETDDVTTSEESFDPVSLIRNTVNEFEQRASENNIELAINLPDKLPVKVLGDYEHICKVLHYLTDNAIKFTEQGKVELGLSITAEDKESALLRFSIEDNGPGIRQEIRTAIFSRFSQADDSASRKHQGMGIGLTLSKRIIELMGGQIDVENKTGSGAIFWFELPLKKA